MDANPAHIDTPELSDWADPFSMNSSALAVKWSTVARCGVNARCYGTSGIFKFRFCPINFSIDNRSNCFPSLSSLLPLFFVLVEWCGEFVWTLRRHFRFNRTKYFSTINVY